MPFGKSILPSSDIIDPPVAPLLCDGKDDDAPTRSITSSKEDDDHKSDSKELQLVSESRSGYMLSEVSHSPQYSDDEVMTTTSTVSPNPKKVRCGTNGNCMDEDTDASNALTVEWAKPFIGEVQDWRGSTIKRA